MDNLRERIQAIHDGNATPENQLKLVNRILRLPQAVDSELSPETRERLEGFCQGLVDDAFDRYPKDPWLLASILKSEHCDAFQYWRVIKGLQKVICLQQNAFNMMREHFPPEMHTMFDLAESNFFLTEPQASVSLDIIGN